MRWKLAHDNHSIERVTVSLQFRESIPSKRFQAMVGGLSQVYGERGLTAATQQFVSEIFLEAGRNGRPLGLPFPETFSPDSAGWSFRAVTGQEVREELSIRRDQFSYSTTLYDRWSDFMRRVQDLLTKPLNQALEMVELNAIKLEYWDRFRFDGIPGEANYSELLLAGSKYIPAFSFEERELWHNHIGFFAIPGASQKRLVNLNVDVLDLAKREIHDAADAPRVERSVGIYSMVQDTPQEGLSDSGAAGINEPLNEMHDVLKGLLRDIITADAAKRIGLDASPT